MMKVNKSERIRKVDTLLDPENLALATKIGDETFVPILELCYIALADVYGPNVEDNCAEFVEVYDNEQRHEEFDVVTHYFDSRVGFTLHLQNGYREFELSVDGNRMMIDQLQLFDKLRDWNFDI
jgi:hypothetical protein